METYHRSRDHAIHSHNHSHGHRQPDQRHRLLVKTQFLDRLTARRFPSKIPNDRKSKSLQCVVCNPAVAQMLASQGLPKKRRPGHETAFKCRQCDVSLCIVPCFELYHTMQDYILAYKRLQAEE
ncbi:hypothetical protein DPMN_003645 [Dreissena polymorpha]|uniref:PiggyBac transposable element-derived protein 4 C-terminal zinc-ribbon domain-containing protein n=1 Tax=Dreissena polymorpha TaxID=45954 RepID=A0A9D4MPQ8_DREPO|nr:hypothetical protein DPMN_003645 [Dreissena polymorpha]